MSLLFAEPATHRATHNFSSLSANILERLTDGLDQGETLQTIHLQSYSVSGPPTGVGISVLERAIRNVTVRECDACLSSARDAK